MWLITDSTPHYTVQNKSLFENVKIGVTVALTALTFLTELILRSNTFSLFIILNMKNHLNLKSA